MKFEHIDRCRNPGIHIACFRKLRGLIQEQLAEKIDRTWAYIGSAEAPEMQPYRLLMFDED